MSSLRSRYARRGFLLQGGVALSGGLLASSRWPILAQETEGDRFPISLHQYSLKPLFEADQLSLLDYPAFAKQKLGITNIEFAAEFCQTLYESPDQADAIREQSLALGVKNRILLCADGSALDSPTEAERATAVDEHRKWAQVAERLGCESIRVRASTIGSPKQQLEHAVAGISALCDALRSSKISVLIENIAGHTRDPIWLVEVVERIGKNRVGLVADFGNFDGDIYGGMQRLLPFTQSVCTKSWEFDDAGNETKIDFGRMMKVITASKFRGCIAIEYLGKESVAGILQTKKLIQRYS
jgi:L-ribulose-5-phosphate 3-epimerase